MFQGGKNNDVHLSGDSKESLYKALELTYWKMEERIGQIFEIREGGGAPAAEDFPLSCNYEEQPASPDYAANLNRIIDVETRLQALENKLIHGTAQLKVENTPGSLGIPNAQASSIQQIEAMLHKVESKLEAIEQRMQHRPAEIATPPALAAGPIRAGVTPVDMHTTQSGETADSRENLIVPIPCNTQPLGTGPSIWVVSGETNVRLSPPRSSPLSSRDGIECDDFNSTTDMTPSASTSERSVTPKPSADEAGRSVPTSLGQDEAVDHNQHILRQEINKALAGAMIELGGLLWRVDKPGA